jgi:hypothetical protein
MKLLVNLEDVLKKDSGCIYYSANTIWWTDDEDDLCKPTPEYMESIRHIFGDVATDAFIAHPIPLDPFNSPLYQTENIKAFADKKRLMEHEAYGRDVENRVETFMWSHAKNMAMIMGAIALSEDKDVLTRFQNFHLLLKELGIFNKQEQV